MTAPQWFSGPPPAVGWWPASAFFDVDLYRWWDGQKWSIAATRLKNHHFAASISRHAAVLDDIRWRRWSADIDGTDGKGAHE